MKQNKRLFKLLLCAIVISLVAIAGVAAEEQVVKGTVEQTDVGFVIEAEDANYIVVGQDLSEMVGKEVMVTGTVSESEEGKTLIYKAF